MIKTILGMPKAVQDRFKVLHMLSDKRSKLNDEFKLISWLIQRFLKLNLKFKLNFVKILN